MALLYNINSLPLDVLAFPRIKNNVIALLPGQQPQAGRLNIRTLGVIFGLLTLIGFTLSLRSLWRFNRWRQKARTVEWWRLLPGAAWKFFPAILLVALPALLPLMTDRIFGAAMLWRAMPEVFLWLAACAVPCVINGAARICYLRNL